MTLLIVIAIVIIIVLFIFFMSGDDALRKAMMGSYNGIKNMNPGMSDEFYLKESLRMRFRNWPDYKLELFIEDCNDIDELINKIYNQESTGVI
jgi:hypothetical protein